MSHDQCHPDWHPHAALDSPGFFKNGIAMVRMSVGGKGVKGTLRGQVFASLGMEEEEEDAEEEGKRKRRGLVLIATSLSQPAI